MINKELNTLKNKCLLFNQFMIEKGGFPEALQSSFVESNKLVEEAYAKGNIKMLKAMSKDIDDQIFRHMPMSMALDLKSFSIKFDFNFEAIGRARIKAIDKIIKKGKISNREEFELVISHVDEICRDPANSSDVKVLNGLLSAFEINPGR